MVGMVPYIPTSTKTIKQLLLNIKAAMLSRRLTSAPLKISSRCLAVVNQQKRTMAAVATVAKEQVPINDGDRFLVKDNGAGVPLTKGPILLAKVQGKFYAIHSICPHMNKSMEKGPIFTDEGPDPILRCRIHNSRFNMRTGTCVKWVTGALGYDNALVGRVASSIGGSKQDIPAYTVHMQDDGSLTIEDPK
jgi:nitrite reductase/ring-hydroxylating ferredoxin subunit